MRAAIRRFDDSVDGLFGHLRGHRSVDRLFYTASALGDFGLVWVMLALVRALRGRPNDERAGARSVVATGVESVLVNAGLKALFGRGRPLAPDIVHPFPFRQPLTSSFPSGHATAAFCAATLLSEGDDLACAYFAAATVIAFSRVHVRIHHASDVLGGIAVGLALGRIGAMLSPLPDPPIMGLRARPKRPLTHTWQEP
ncbi:MAG: phosphatase PAP2 family protein [Acidimicrobiales bacterium]